MQKIGILTFHQVANYGAVLQCFALKKTIEDLGMQCDVINYKCKQLEKNESIIKWNKHFAISLMKFLSQGVGTKNKRRAFDRFLKIRCNIEIAHEVDGSQLYYHTYITGSDQVWNLKLTNNDFTYFLENIHDAKKIAYAASFGENAIIKEYEERILKDIQCFDYVSVREIQAKEYLQQKEIYSELVCDPVFLLSQSEWVKLLDNSKLESEKFLLLYCIEKDEKTFEFARKIASAQNLKVIYINQNFFFKEKGFTYKRGIGPEEFLWYLYNAEIVVTNSFHGTSFSIIFHKSFITDIWWRGKENQRIKSLLHCAGLSHRTIDTMEKNLNVFEDLIDYKEVDEKITLLRKKSLDFLWHAIGGDK